MLRGSLLVGLLALLGVSSASAQIQYPVDIKDNGNCVVDVFKFNQEMGAYLTTRPGPYFVPASRENALNGIAVHDAINTISQEYPFFYGDVRQDAGIPKSRANRANLCAAAYAAFKTQYTNATRERTQSNGAKQLTVAEQDGVLAKLEEWYNFHMTRLQNAPGVKAKEIEDGVAIGVASAEQVLRNRQNDGYAASYPAYNPVPEVGKWYNPPGNVYVYPQWLDVKLFVMPKNELWRPPNPHVVQPLDSQVYLDSLAETKRLGNKGENERTQQQSESAIWWSQGSLGHVALVVHDLVLRLGYSEHKAAAAYAAMFVAGADSVISNTNHKYAFQYIRPYQALNNAFNLDYSAYPALQAMQDPTWESFITTPNNEEYPAGHPQITGCSSFVLQLLFGFDEFPGGPVSVNYKNLSGGYTVPHQVFKSFSDVREQGSMARIYGGMHLRPSCAAGTNLGLQIAMAVYQRFRPIA